jgi:hypothetical protein
MIVGLFPDWTLVLTFIEITSPRRVAPAAFEEECLV